MKVGLAAANRHGQLEAALPRSVPPSNERVEAKRQVGDHRRNVECLCQRHGMLQAAQFVLRPAGRIKGEKRAVQNDDGQIMVAGQGAQIVRLAGIPAVIDHDLDPVKAGARREIKDACSAIAVERAGRKDDHAFSASNSSIISLNTSKPPCQKSGEAMSKPASPMMCAGLAEPP